MKKQQLISKVYHALAKPMLRTYGTTLQSSTPKDFNKFIQQLGTELALDSTKTILDCGSGFGGPLQLLCQKFNSQGVGIELVLEPQVSDPKLTFRRMDMDDLHLLSEQYDVILFLETIGHSKNAKKLLSKAAARLKPDGLLCIKCYDKSQPLDPLFAGDAQHYLGYSVHGSKRLQKWAEEVGLSLKVFRDLRDTEMLDQSIDVYAEVGIKPNTEFVQMPIPYYMILEKK